jgi:hypothetical protein
MKINKKLSFDEIKNRWHVGGLCRFSFKVGKKRFNRVLRILSINMYHRDKGDVQMTLQDEKTKEIFNSAYEKNRFKVTI